MRAYAGERVSGYGFELNLVWLHGVERRIANISRTQRGDVGGNADALGLEGL